MHSQDDNSIPIGDSSRTFSNYVHLSHNILLNALGGCIEVHGCFLLVYCHMPVHYNPQTACCLWGIAVCGESLSVGHRCLRGIAVCEAALSVGQRCL